MGGGDVGEKVRLGENTFTQVLDMEANGHGTGS